MNGEIAGCASRPARRSRCSTTSASAKPVHALVSPWCLTGSGSAGNSVGGGADEIAGTNQRSRKSIASGRAARFHTAGERGFAVDATGDLPPERTDGLGLRRVGIGTPWAVVHPIVVVRHAAGQSPARHGRRTTTPKRLC